MKAQQQRARWRIGVDIGGTFTDLVMAEAGGSRLFNEKVLTTPDDPSRGVLAGIELILRNNGVDAADVENVIHGTTLVANALIERKGVRTALVTTDGFRDVLEIGREWRYDIYDVFLTPVEALVPRHLRFEVKERIGYDGSVVQALDVDGIERIAQQIAASGVQAVAVCFLHSFRRADHERQAAEILRARLPQVTVCLSSEVMPEIGEYERTATAVCNAYVQPLFRKYINGLLEGLRQMGIHRELYLMQSDGGTVSSATAIEYPIRLVQSGPAGGVQATSLIGRLAGCSDILCFDMGGTTAKACLIDQGEPTVTTDFEVARLQRFRKGSGIPLKVPAVDMIEIGSGGGSISRVNGLGLIQVGPDSSSAQPGPACYAQGGQDPTVTDADLLLGYLDADSFLGGDMKLDRQAAERAMQERLAGPLALSLTEAALGIHETVNETMAQAAGIHALEKGKKASDYAMVPIGGAGPVHACHVAQKLGIRRVVVPMGAGVASAFGFLASPMSFQFVQAGIAALTGLDVAAARALVHGLEAKGRSLLEASGVAPADCRVRVSAAMRYVGQGYEVEVPVQDLAADGLPQRLAAAFDRSYVQLYGRTEKDTPAEIVSWRVVVQGPVPELTRAVATPSVSAATARDRADTARSGERQAFSIAQRRFVATPVFSRYRLQPGAQLQGPAIIEERESTVVVPDGAQVSVDGLRNLVIDLPQGAA
jgi:N-methylhydantoinase A